MLSSNRSDNDFRCPNEAEDKGVATRKLIFDTALSFFIKAHNLKHNS